MALTATFRRLSVSVRERKASVLHPRRPCQRPERKWDEQRGYTSQAMFRAEGTPKPSLRIPASFRARTPGRGFPPLNTRTQRRAALANPRPTVRRLDARQRLPPLEPVLWVVPPLNTPARVPPRLHDPKGTPAPLCFCLAKCGPLPATFSMPNSPDDLPDFHPQTVLRDWGNGQAFRLADALTGVSVFGTTGSGRTTPNAEIVL